jgi:hypothetical protein
MFRKTLSVIAFALAGISAGAQTSTYYYGVNDKPVNAIEQARNYKEVKQRSKNSYRIKTYTLVNGEWLLNNVEKAKKNNNKSRYQFRYRQNTFFPRFFKRELEATDGGNIRFKDTNRGKLLKEGITSNEIPLHLNGKVTEYHPDQTISSESVYEDNQLISNKYWNPEGNLVAEDIFFNVDRNPNYIPGDQILKSYIISRIAEENLPVTEIQDELLIGWIVTDKGSVGEVVILQGRVKSVNDFFKRTIASLPGEWEPAELNGEKVNYFITMPVTFSNTVPMLQNVDYAGGMLMWNY